MISETSTEINIIPTSTTQTTNGMPITTNPGEEAINTSSVAKQTTIGKEINSETREATNQQTTSVITQTTGGMEMVTEYREGTLSVTMQQ